MLTYITVRYHTLLLSVYILQVSGSLYGALIGSALAFTVADSLGCVMLSSLS